jgi:hypothetical protein
MRLVFARTSRPLALLAPTLFGWPVSRETVIDEQELKNGNRLEFLFCNLWVTSSVRPCHFSYCINSSARMDSNISQVSRFCSKVGPDENERESLRVMVKLLALVDNGFVVASATLERLFPLDLFPKLNPVWKERVMRMKTEISEQVAGRSGGMARSL